MNLLDALDASQEILPEGVALFRRRAGDAILKTALAILKEAPARNMATPFGKTMSAKITNCGPLGWVSDKTGYRYSPVDPVSGLPWPPMPDCFFRLAADSAARAGYPGFAPDACLVNFYEPGTKMGAHQDRDERDFAEPIVSVSLGAAAIFRFGGRKRADPAQKIRLDHGDILVFGGPARLCFHGIDRLLPEPHPILGQRRINLTFRRAT